VYFHYHFDRERIRRLLERSLGEWEGDRKNATGRALRLRLLCDERGGLEIEISALEAAMNSEEWRAGIAAKPVDSSDVFLFHKTTHREAYEAARAGRPGTDEVILYNERGEL